MEPQRDPGGKFTLFSLLTLVGAVFGAGTGFALGVKLHQHFGPWVGWPVGIIGTILGFAIGTIPGRVLGDMGIMSLFRELNNLETPELYNRLEKNDSIAHLALLILKERGENPQQLVSRALEKLLDPNADIRWQYWRALSLNFPEVAEQLQGIDPHGSPDVYRDRVLALQQTPPPVNTP